MIHTENVRSTNEVYRKPMSNPSPLSNDAIPSSNHEADAQHVPRRRRLLGSLKRPVEFGCFWLAIALPFVYFPLLMGGLGETMVALAFVALLAVNVVALYIGHGYNQA